MKTIPLDVAEDWMMDEGPFEGKTVGEVAEHEPDRLLKYMRKLPAKCMTRKAICVVLDNLNGYDPEDDHDLED